MPEKAQSVDLPLAGPRWKIVCVLLVIPLTAMLHQAVFFPGMCMLNRIGPDYYPAVVMRWLSRDPSLPIAVAVAVAAYLAGNRSGTVRTLAWPFVVAFVPLSIWLWDIPFTGRAVCHAFHDGRLTLENGMVVSSRWFYAAGAVTYTLIVGYLMRRSKGAQTLR